MKAEVDRAMCQGHTLCHLAAPEVFALSDEDGHAYVKISADLPAGLEAAARDAAATCPELAVRLT
ncbi:ferredoxin [Pseudonocardia sp. N23]|uniref:ferredoxin n=1 Tax=Pseudonocardia sp. N23 TaxID=1987376 RepID=UPI000BFD5EC2|nr:ferredoxin [Pseudonocardia sp. N23]GAY11622.1 hypothetical protein TOK_0002 [Pseudonocardia sp. N23]